MPLYQKILIVMSCAFSFIVIAACFFWVGLVVAYILSI